MPRGIDNGVERWEFVRNERTGRLRITKVHESETGYTQESRYFQDREVERLLLDRLWPTGRIRSYGSGSLPIPPHYEDGGSAA
jgi:hypothetical protein